MLGPRGDFDLSDALEDLARTNKFMSWHLTPAPASTAS